MDWASFLPAWSISLECYFICDPDSIHLSIEFMYVSISFHDDVGHPLVPMRVVDRSDPIRLSCFDDELLRSAGISYSPRSKTRVVTLESDDNSALTSIKLVHILIICVSQRYNWVTTGLREKSCDPLPQRHLQPLSRSHLSSHQSASESLKSDRSTDDVIILHP